MSSQSLPRARGTPWLSLAAPVRCCQVVEQPNGPHRRCPRMSSDETGPGAYFSIKYGLCKTCYRRFSDHRRQVAGWEASVTAIADRASARQRCWGVLPPPPDALGSPPAPDAFFYVPSQRPRNVATVSSESCARALCSALCLSPPAANQRPAAGRVNKLCKPLARIYAH